MNRSAALAFADQLRSAREAALDDAEAFDGIIYAVERLGSFLTQRTLELGRYKDEVSKIASTSALAEVVPESFRGELARSTSAAEYCWLGFTLQLPPPLVKARDHVL